MTLAFIEVHTDLNHKNNKCSIISKTVLAIPTEFAVKIARLKVCIIVASAMTLVFAQGYKCVSNLTHS